MSRYVIELPVNKSPEQIADITARYMSAQGFMLAAVKDEQVWKKGDGFLVAPQLVSVKTIAGSVKVEAWIKFALLPFVFVGEMGLDGFFGAIPKGMLRDKVTMLVKLITE